MNELTGLEDTPDAARISDILKRIRLEHEEVGQLGLLHGSEHRLLSDYLGGPGRLPPQSPPLESALSPRAD